MNNLNYNTTNRNTIIQLHNAQLPHSSGNNSDTVRYNVWQKLIQQSKLSFPMVMRLAEYIINTNPKIKNYLQQTYHFVFLDEFQDTTELQYDLFKTCFLDSQNAYTAVGDDKQRIMMWAGARETVFEDFISDVNATRVPLNMNFRCAPRLVTLLNHLTLHLLGKDDLATASPKWKAEQGECYFWVFENAESEMQILFHEIQNWISVDGINPRDICILIKQQLEQYAGNLI